LSTLSEDQIQAAVEAGENLDLEQLAEIGDNKLKTPIAKQKGTNEQTEIEDMKQIPETIVQAADVVTTESEVIDSLAANTIITSGKSQKGGKSTRSD